MTFSEDHYADYVAPRLVVRLLEDRLGAPYLLLSGPEPDIRWEGFARAVRLVVEHFAVRLVVSLGSVPMAVPHTRPVQLTNHATSARLLVQENVWKGEIRVPASAQSLLELRLGEWGHDAMGFVAHIPHYVAQFAYPQASAGPARGRRGRDRAAVGHRAAARGRRGPPGGARHADRRLRRGPRGGHRPRAAVRRLPHRLGEPAGRRPAAAERRGARASSSSSSSPASRTRRSSPCHVRSRSWSSSWSSRPSRTTCSAASSHAPVCSASSVVRSPPRRWQPPPAPSRRSTSCTACTPTSCGRATPRCRSSTTSTPCGRAAASPPAASWPASTAGRSSR